MKKDLEIQILKDLVNMYPTKDEILNAKQNFKKETILIVKLWKAQNYKGWKDKNKKIQIDSLVTLINALCKVYKVKKPKIKANDEYMYNTKTKTIYLDPENPSIISTLHELAHHMFKADEYKACIWSVWLFKKCFPKSAAKLKWDQHLLIK